MSQAGRYIPSGGPTPPASPPGYGQIYNASDQNINNGNTITFDSNGPLLNISHVVGSDTITVNATGTYLITWTVSTQGDGGAYTLLHNGAAISTLSFVTDTGNGQSIGNGIVNLNAGDTIQLRNNTGVLIALQSQAGYVNASITFEKLIAGGASSGTNTLVGNVGSATQVGGIIDVVTANSTFLTSGSGNTLTLDFFQSNSNIGSNLPALTTGLRNTGYGAGVNQNITSGNDNSVFGYDAFINATTASQNSSFGVEALKFANGNSNTAIGYQSLSFLTSGTNNIALGFQSGLNATTNNSCIYIGTSGVATENNVIRIGTDGNGIGQQNTTIIAGDVASVRSFTADSGNITTVAGDVVINGGNLQITADTNNTGTQGLITFLGSGSVNRLISMRGVGNTFVGYQSGNVTLIVASAIGNSGFGLEALQALTSGSGNVAMGQSAGTAITTGSNNVALGLDALEFLTTGSNNIAIGDGAGSAYTIESNNIVLGLTGVAADSGVTRIANIYGTTVGGTNAVVVIDNTGKLGTAGGGADFIATITGNTGGAETPSAGNFNFLTANSTVIFAGTAATETLDFNRTTNLILGSSLPSLAGGTSNTGIGYQSCVGITSGSNNAAVGRQALNTVSSGINNSCLGSLAGSSLTTGGNNIGVGINAASSYTTESNNICIGSGLSGTIGDSGVIRIGNTATNSSCFIAGIDGVNVGSVARVVTEASNQLGTAVLTAGANITITPGANTITIAANASSETVNYTSVNHAASPYVVLATDYYLGVDVSAGVVTIQLPNAPSTGRVFVVKDKAGDAATNNITVTTVGGVDLIDGFTTFTMNNNYQAAQFIWNGSSYEIF